MRTYNCFCLDYGKDFKKELEKTLRFQYETKVKDKSILRIDILDKLKEINKKINS